MASGRPAASSTRARAKRSCHSTRSTPGKCAHRQSSTVAHAPGGRRSVLAWLSGGGRSPASIGIGLLCNQHRTREPRRMWEVIGSTIAHEFSDIPDLADLTRLSLRLLLAALLGGLLGYERETKGKAAGIKTHM